MAIVAPPPAPPVVAQDDFDHRRFRVRTMKLLATFITVLLSAWLFTLGKIPGLLGLLVAKHVLVAIFLMGSGVHDPRLLPPPRNPDGMTG
jgi:hypothetical protein